MLPLFYIFGSPKLHCRTFCTKHPSQMLVAFSNGIVIASRVIFRYSPLSHTMSHCCATVNLLRDPPLCRFPFGYHPSLCYAVLIRFLACVGKEGSSYDIHGIAVSACDNDASGPAHLDNLLLFNMQQNRTSSSRATSARGHQHGECQGLRPAYSSGKRLGCTLRRDVGNFGTDHRQPGCYNDEREGRLPGYCQGRYSPHLLRALEVSAYFLPFPSSCCVNFAMNITRK
jgi:hypothetical protein